ncbi:MAG: DUF433 domain-containing protein [Spirochaetaceae bacterium]|nr:DUF433 domain-containing protein [Spirochaetaceae bacterium]
MNDVSTLGAYTFADAARYVVAPVATVRAWFLGTTTGAGRFERVLQLDDSEHRMLSFRNLVELHVLNSVRRRHRVTLFKVRTAIAILSEAWGSDHPLAERDMLTDGYDLFAHVAGLLTNVSTSDQQILLDKVLQAALRRIDRHPAGGAAKLFPFPADDLESEEPKTIEIDPSVQFGRPCLTGTGIPTEALYDRHAGGEAVDQLADDYGLAGERVRDAIEYEEQLRTRLCAA